MKMRLPVFVVVLAVMALLTGIQMAFADTVLVTAGPLALHLPLSNARVTYAYDGPSLTNVVGAETVVVSAWKIEGTAGAITSLSGQGTPFIGLNLSVDNPLAAHLNLGPIQPGVFGGYDFNRHAFMVGPKFSVNLF